MADSKEKSAPNEGGIVPSSDVKPENQPQTIHDEEIGHSNSIDMPKQHMDYGRVDREVAEYAGAGAIVIDKETDKRLKRMIDKRVLTIMVATYFLQALDKGTLSFTSIMGLQEDTGLHGQQVSHRVLINDTYELKDIFSSPG